MALQGKRFWLGTWNCENQAPGFNNNGLDAFIVNPISNTQPARLPHLILLGFQELKKKATRQVLRSSEFPHERLAKAKDGRLGRAGQRRYLNGGSSSARGMTKLSTNYQQLGLLVKNGEQVANFQTGSFTHHGGKGGVYMTFTYEGSRFAVISAHLESKNADHQTAEIDRLLRDVSGLQGNPGRAQVRRELQRRFHTVFFMGDLNYRVRGDQHQGIDPAVKERTRINGVKCRIYNLPGDVIPSKMKGKNMAATILSAAGRNNLLRYDMLEGSPLRADYGFTLPIPQGVGTLDPSFPTYKRNYQNRGSVPNFIHERSLQNAIAAYKLSQNEEVKRSRDRNYAFEIGWLDRVGYLTNHAPEAVEFYDCEASNLSDHTPVMMKYTFA